MFMSLFCFINFWEFHFADSGTSVKDDVPAGHGLSQAAVKLSQISTPPMMSEILDHDAHPIDGYPWIVDVTQNQSLFFSVHNRLSFFFNFKPNNLPP